jgi:hypothetical protein
MNIALIMPNSKSLRAVPSLGVGYLSSYLKQNKHDALIIDALCDDLSDEDVYRKMLEKDITTAGITRVSFKGTSKNFSFLEVFR